MSDGRLPELADIEAPLADAELEASYSCTRVRVLRKQFEREGMSVTPQTKFNYAWGLVKSHRKAEQVRGVRLLTELCRNSPQRQREGLYYLALGHYKLGNYHNARECVDQLLDLEPHNGQAKALRSLIERKVTRDGVLGFAIVGSLVAAASIVAAQLLRRKE
ncbi:hypothetical protein THASP1DRAFT_31734 [Thamnocephalis sphaerospora]|uniref:Mitochondrial fission 1 protein n=1 Tax=Thamnocephalis sphaerospora TaxID=78915 RepID=A0A4P9XKV6_9FUNG|nr:hypothetical protein THASP1DRAFT_31734 [Thamnocephalis sphaerospora]|eukprot:RKP06448.1 hypothetical protein THASP1DRAFT_31734 [Thamnocephalis sphaerospora]